MKQVWIRRVLVPGIALVTALTVIVVLGYPHLSRWSRQRARDPGLRGSVPARPSAGEEDACTSSFECPDARRRDLLAQAVTAILALSEPPPDETDDLERLVCRHGSRTIDCDACRAGIGVLRLPPDIAEYLLRGGSACPRRRPEKLAVEGKLEFDVSRLATIIAPVEGRVEEVRTSTGESVSRGDVVVVLHSQALASARLDHLAARTHLEFADVYRSRLAGLTGQLEADVESAGAAPVTAVDESPLSAEDSLKLLTDAVMRLRKLRGRVKGARALTREGESQGQPAGKAQLELREFRALVQMQRTRIRTAFRAESRRAEIQAEEARRELAGAVERLESFDLEPEELGNKLDWKEASNLASLSLRSPLTGTVTSLPVQPGSRTGRYQNLATIADLTRLLLFAEVDPEVFDRVRTAQVTGGSLLAGIRLADQCGELFVGEVRGVQRGLGPGRRSGSLVIDVRNEAGALRPGMDAMAWIDLPDSQGVMTVPRNALWGRRGDRFLLIHWKDGLWVRRDVILNKCRGKQVDVRGNLPEGAVLGVCRLHER